MSFLALARSVRIRASVVNISWLTLDNVINTATNAAVGFLVARHFGIQQFGIWSYTFAIYAFALTAVTMGLDELIVVEYAAASEDCQRLMVAAFVLRSCVGLFGMIALDSIFLFTPHPPLERALMLVFAANLLVCTPDVIGAWLRARSAFKTVAIPSIFAGLIANAAKIAFIVIGLSIVSLGVATILQMAVFESILLIIFLRSGFRLRIADFDFNILRRLFISGLPLMIASVAPLLYTRLNIVLIDLLTDKASVGIYSAASRISSVFYSIPMVFFLAMSPQLYAIHRRNRSAFYDYVRVTLTVYFSACSLFCILVTIFSRTIITDLYGRAFAEAAPILAVHIWTIIPVGYGVISAMCLIAENLGKIMMARTLVGGGLNIALTFLLVSRYGIIGAAASTLVSMFVAAVFYHAIVGGHAREIFRYQIRTLFFCDIPLSLTVLRGHGLD